MVVPQSLLGFEPFASDQKPIWGVKSSDESGSIHSMAVEPVSKRCISANRTELGAEKVPRRGTLTRGKHLRGKSRAGCHKIPPHSRVINNPTVVSGTPKGDPTRGCGSSWRGQGQRRRVSQHCCRCASVPNLLATERGRPPCIDCYEQDTLLSTANILLFRAN